MPMIQVEAELYNFDDQALIEELECRGYVVYAEDKYPKKLDEKIWKLYQAFQLDNENNQFERECRKFFADYYNKVSV
jgi:hypothetical protein